MARLQVTIEAEIPEDEDPDDYVERVAGWAVPTLGSQLRNREITDVSLIEE